MASLELAEAKKRDDFADVAPVVVDFLFLEENKRPMPPRLFSLVDDVISEAEEDVDD